MTTRATYSRSRPSWSSTRCSSRTQRTGSKRWIGWPLLAAESNFGNAYELFAIGLSAARSRNREVASRVVQALGQRAQDPREGDLRPAIAIMQQEVAAIVSLVEGRSDPAVEALRAAVAVLCGQDAEVVLERTRERLDDCDCLDAIGGRP